MVDRYASSYPHLFDALRGMAWSEENANDQKTTASSSLTRRTKFVFLFGDLNIIFIFTEGLDLE
jgi:zona occludens toxin (predicted ATPase)